MGIQSSSHSPGSASPGKFFDPDGVMQVGAALAAVGLREFQTQKPELTAASVKLAGELSLVFPLVDIWCDLVLDEAPD